MVQILIEYQIKEGGEARICNHEEESVIDDNDDSDEDENDDV